MKYWYHPESDCVFEAEALGDSFDEALCNEITKEEYDAFNLGRRQVMTIEELSNRYKSLEKEARETSLTIGQHEQRIDTALDSLKEVLPDQDVSDPRAIPFDELIKSTQEEIDKLTNEIAEDFDTLEKKVEDANSELRNLVESGN